MKSLAVLSNKGGVGKTCIAVNVSVYLAKRGKNVCLLDQDFQGPSLMTYFEPKVSWINDYLTKSDDLETHLQKIDSKAYNLKGKLYVGFANPTHESIRSNLNNDTQKSMVMLQNLIKLKKLIQTDPFNIDYFILDCSPGLSFLSVNPILVSDISLFVLKISNADIYGTTEMISGLYDKLQNKSFILANHIPIRFINDNTRMKSLESLIKKRFIDKTGNKDMEFLGWIPADTELFTSEFDQAVASFTNETPQREIFLLDYPDHSFSQTLISLIPKIFGDL